MYSMLERMMAFLRPFAGLTHFNDDRGALWRQMQAAIERHDLLDRGRAEIDAVALFQIALNAKPAGIAVFLLQREDGVNRFQVNLALWPVRRAWQIDQ